MNSSKEALAKIHQALGRLGVSFAEVFQMVDFDPELDTACWVFHEKTQRQQILLGPAVTALDLSSIEMVLRHELLHASTYNHFHQRFLDQELANLVEDICINRLLFECYPDKMLKLSLQIYTDETRQSIVALPDCSADPNLLENLQWRELWHYIWDKDEMGNPREINPASLYYRLLEIRNQSKTGSFLIPLPMGLSVHRPLPGQGFSQPVEKAMNQNIISMRNQGSTPSMAEFNSFLATQVQFRSDEVLRFIESIKVDRIVSESSQKIRELVIEEMSELYPMYPTRRGLVYLVAGLSDHFMLYHNRYSISRPVRLALAFYVDISGSMTYYFSAINSFLKAVFDVPLKVKLFDTAVREISAEKFLAGKFKAGGGTDFNRVLQDFAEDDEVGSAIVFTDGEADVSKESGDLFDASGKRLFAVYFSDTSEEAPASKLNRYLISSMTIRLD